MTYRCSIRSGRRIVDYKVDAESKEQALERFTKYMAFLGAIVTEPVEALPDENLS